MKNHEGPIELIPYLGDATFDVNELVGWSIATPEHPSQEPLVVLTDGDGHETHILQPTQARQLAYRMLEISDRVASQRGLLRVGATEEPQFVDGRV